MLRSGWQWDDRSRKRAPVNAPLPLVAARRPAIAEEETIFSLLADRARSHSVGHLTLTATVGLVDAAALGWKHPAAWPLATLCAAAGLYGLWGLIDRALSVRVSSGLPDAAATNLLRIVRELVALVGLGATLAAAGGLFGASLGTWIS